MALTLYLVPRAPTEWTTAGRWQGEADLPPTPPGVEQVKKWAGDIALMSRRDSLGAPPVSGGVWQGLVVALTGEDLPAVSRTAENTEAPAAPEQPGEHLAAIYSGEGATSKATAEILSSILGVPCAVDPQLSDVALGLWQGLTTEQLAKQHGKAFRAWQEDPAIITPPEGENLSEVRQRLAKAVQRLHRKYNGRQLVLVLGPLSMTLVQMVLTGAAWKQFWEIFEQPPAVRPFLCEKKPKTTAAKT